MPDLIQPPLPDMPEPDLDDTDNDSRELEGVDPDVIEQLKRVREHNAGQYRTLMAQGAGVNPVSILDRRLGALIEFLIRDDDARARFELLFEESLVAMFARANSEVAQAKLLHGPDQQMGGTGGLFLPGQ